MDIKVSPLEFREKAEKISADIEEITNAFEAFAGLVSASDYYWMGEAGVYYRTLYTEETKEMEKILKRLKSYSEELLQAAGIPLEEERKHAGEEPLPGDVIR